MKFVHIADLHLGKVVHQYSLLNIQKELLQQLLNYMNEQNLKVLVIAGDIYDRSVPPQEAVNVLDHFLDQAINQYHITVMMISGNHDSSDRLNFASSLLKKQGLYIETQVHEQMEPIIIDDVNFYLLPFFKPSLIRMLYNDDHIVTYQQAFETYFEHQHIDPSHKNVLVTHQFVGRNSITSDSEMILSVGGSEIIDATLFNDFDYVALGHLHAPQKVSRETMRYSGSLMRYSFDEVKQNKSIVICDTDDFSLSFHKLSPSIDFNIIQGTYHELTENNDYKKDDLLLIELLDEKIVPHAVENLRTLYPHLLQLNYPKMIREDHIVRESKAIEQMSEEELYKSFYQYITGHEIDQGSIEIIQKIEKEVEECDQ